MNGAATEIERVYENEREGGDGLRMSGGVIWGGIENEGEGERSRMAMDIGG